MSNKYSKYEDRERTDILCNFEPTFAKRITNYDNEKLKKMYKYFMECYGYFWQKIVDGLLGKVGLFYNYKKDHIALNKIRLLLVCIAYELKDRILSYEKDKSSQNFTDEECKEIKENISKFLKNNDKYKYISSTLDGAYSIYYTIVNDTMSHNFYDNIDI